MIQLQLSPETPLARDGHMQHAALHIHGQHIVWRQVIMKLKDTFRAAPLSKGAALKRLDAEYSKK